MPGKKYTEEHKVVYFETNVTGRLNIGNLVDLCMLVSTDQSSNLGISTEKLDSMGYIFFLAQCPLLKTNFSNSTHDIRYKRPVSSNGCSSQPA